jgi:hypothetical protein
MKSNSSPSETVPCFAPEGRQIQGDGLTEPQIRYVSYDAAAPAGPSTAPAP